MVMVTEDNHDRGSLGNTTRIISWQEHHAVGMGQSHEPAAIFILYNYQQITSVHALVSNVPSSCY